MMAPLPREDDRGCAAPGGRRCHPGGGCCSGGVCGAGGPSSTGDCASSVVRPMERWCMRRRRRKMAIASTSRDGPPGEGAASSPGGCERCCSGMDYHQHDDGCHLDNSCDNVNNNNSSSNNNDNSSRDNDEEAGGPFSLPARLPRSRICGDDGPSEGEGGQFAQDAPWPPSPLFLAASRPGDGGARVTATPSSGRGGDGAAVHFSKNGIKKSAADGYGVGVGRTWCFGRSRRGGCSDGVFSRSLLLASLLWLSLGALLVDGASASIMGDGCDWSGSGLMAEMEVSREGGGVGVRPVYLRCSQGAVSWAYPRGALRVLLRLAGGGEEFRGCVRLGRTWKGARLFLEGVRSLHPLFPGVEDGGAEQHAKGGTGVRCFQSRKGQAALYVEATPGGVSPRGRTVASFEYHLQPLPSGVKSFDPSEECRPCTMDEMTHAFCSSDLVTRGTIRSVESHDDPETSELRVRVTKLIRRTRAPPPALEGDPFDDDEAEEGELQEEEAKGGGREGRHWWDSADRGASVTLHVPTHCGARHGAGEFVFMAQRKLGQLRLRCAPRLEDWAALARKANRLAASPCVLQA